MEVMGVGREDVFSKEGIDISITYIQGYLKTKKEKRNMFCAVWVNINKTNRRGTTVSKYVYDIYTN